MTPRTLEPSAQRLEAKGGDSDVEDEETAGGDAGDDFARGRAGDEHRPQRGPERGACVRRWADRLLRLSGMLFRYEEPHTGLLVLRTDMRSSSGIPLLLVEDERCIQVFLRVS